jgi:hypothetical protein
MRRSGTTARGYGEELQCSAGADLAGIDKLVRPKALQYQSRRMH